MENIPSLTFQIFFCVIDMSQICYKLLISLDLLPKSAGNLILLICYRIVCYLLYILQLKRFFFFFLFSKEELKKWVLCDVGITVRLGYIFLGYNCWKLRSVLHHGIMNKWSLGSGILIHLDLNPTIFVIWGKFPKISEPLFLYLFIKLEK